LEVKKLYKKAIISPLKCPNSKGFENRNLKKLKKRKNMKIITLTPQVVDSTSFYRAYGVFGNLRRKYLPDLRILNYYLYWMN